MARRFGSINLTLLTLLTVTTVMCKPGGLLGRKVENRSYSSYVEEYVDCGDYGQPDVKNVSTDDCPDFQNTELICDNTISDTKIFKCFEMRFKRKYKPEEVNMRMCILLKNIKVICEHNKEYEAGYSTYMLGVNQFADWSNEDRKYWSGPRSAY